MTVLATLKKALLPCALVLGAVSFSLPAVAFVEEITATFRPDPSNPLSNKFTNTTPQSGMCAWHANAIARCKALGIFGIRYEGFAASSVMPIPANHDDPRKAAYFKVPSSWRDVQVTHAGTGATETLQMRIAAIGTRWDVPRPPGVSGWATPANGWSYYWYVGAPPCQGIGYIAASQAFALFFWTVPEGAGACFVKPGTEFPGMRYSHMEYAYELKTPNPLGMEAGEYTGSVSYTMGPGGDFDFGDAMIPTDNIATFNFTLDVTHILNIELPPGGNRVELLPEGGWQAWLSQGRRPSRLYRDQTFRIAASGRFKMTLECGLVNGNTCGLRNGQGDEVPVQIAVSLPHGLNDQYGQAVNKLPLRLDGSGTELFQATQYLNNRPGTLHFQIEKEDVGEVLKQPGATYSGVATVVWDSEV
ncbi:hypothetical protein GIR22_06860 [Pseudomonas sp. CCM 7891]|uniref:Uncharacterized protein n=1 Tax=Pseudomonas karstica TaxID=1055468 RepID=A0A7X2UXC6_9PSED|nr:hypothetical protein [Pseudomonas karstica]MTD18869.1 hypothetical protein [Pseudomonas karstica]